MDTIIIILISLAVGVITILFFLRKKKDAVLQMDELERVPVVRNLNRPRANENHPARNRLRNRPAAHNNANNNAVAQDELDDEMNGEERDEFDLESQEIGNLNPQDREDMRKKIGTKKLAKLEGKAEKRKQNEDIIREREERKEEEDLAYEVRKKTEKETERLEKEKEAEELLVKQEQERIEHEEYLKLKEAFSVEEEGQDEAMNENESQNLLLEFVEFIKKSKVVVLEDLAAEFKLKTVDVINRVSMVQEMGLLTGLMDDRGKFIYISEDELLKVKKFIELRGRVNITEIAKSSNELINLQPVASVVEIDEQVIEA